MILLILLNIVCLVYSLKYHSRISILKRDLVRINSLAGVSIENVAKPNTLVKALLSNGLLSIKEIKYYNLMKIYLQLIKKQLGRELTKEEIEKALGTSRHLLVMNIDKSNITKRILIQANMKLVYYTANYYKGYGISYPDLVSEGLCGLVKAFDRYHSDYNIRFSSFAFYWIKQYIFISIKKQSQQYQLADNIDFIIEDLKSIHHSFIISNHRIPSMKELIALITDPIDNLENIIRYSNDIITTDSNDIVLNESINENKLTRLSEYQSTITLADSEALFQILRPIMSSLTDRERDIITMRFGFIDGNPMTLQAIGNHYNVSRERIRQIEVKAFEKMREI